MLAKKYNVDKLTFPVIVTEKLDGVAAQFFGSSGDKNVTVLSRQNKPIYSVNHIREELHGLNDYKHIIGELYIPGKPFSEISGLVRQHASAPDLQLYIYDMHWLGCSLDEYYRRKMYFPEFTSEHVKVIPALAYCGTKEDLAEFVTEWMEDYKNQHKEGLVIRDAHGDNSYYMPGKRSWGMQKLKRVHTVDVIVRDLHEARDEQGNPKGMLGSFEVQYGHVIQYVGAGKLTHEQRIAIWQNRVEMDFLRGKVIEVSHMPDKDYEALRQPIFERFRTDKTEASYE